MLQVLQRGCRLLTNWKCCWQSSWNLRNCLKEKTSSACASSDRLIATFLFTKKFILIYAVLGIIWQSITMWNTFIYSSLLEKVIAHCFDFKVFFNMWKRQKMKLGSSGFSFFFFFIKGSLKKVFFLWNCRTCNPCKRRPLELQICCSRWPCETPVCK